MVQKPKTIDMTMSKIIHQLKQTADTSSTRAILASLRRSINRPAPSLGLVWQLLFSYMPESSLGHSGELNRKERAVLNSLQLYAIYYRGKDITKGDENDKDELTPGAFYLQPQGKRFLVGYNQPNQKTFWQSTNDLNKVQDIMKQWSQKLPSSSYRYRSNLGDTLNRFRQQESDKTAIDRRFSQIISSTNYHNTVQRLYSLIGIIRQQSNFQINFPQLALDLFQLQDRYHGADNVKISWSRAYYKNKGANKHAKQ